MAQSQQRNGPGADVTSTAAARQALEQQRRRPEARALSRDEEDYFAEVSRPTLGDMPAVVHSGHRERGCLPCS